MSRNKYILRMDTFLENLFGQDIPIDTVIIIVAIVLMIVSAAFIMYCYVKIHDWCFLHKTTKRNKK